MTRIRKLCLAACAALAVLLLATGPAQAHRALIREAALETGLGPPVAPPPEGEIEGACGLAVTPGGGIYVSDHYHHAVDLFSHPDIFPGKNESQILTAGPPEGPCGLALSAAGALYANIWHESVVRLKPSFLTVDSGNSTGLALDGAGNLYVNDRTYVAEYEAPIEPGEEPVAKIGLGSLGDAYGLAAFAGRLYVPDAASDTVKVFEPAVSLGTPVATISHGFVSLVDGAVAVDPTNGHLLVVDNTQPGFEHSKAAVYEFDSAGAFLGGLPGSPVHGEPAGIAVDPVSGDLYVTDGNDEGANLFAYGPYIPAPPFSAGAAPAPGASVAPSVSASAAPAGAASRRTKQAASRRARQPVAHVSEVAQHGRLRVSFTGEISPRALPRSASAPVSASVGGQIATTDGSTPPQLRRVAIAINRYGRIDPTGLPICRLQSIQPSTSAGALEACRSSLIGEGSFSANVKLPQQSPFPSQGKVLAFNGALHGHPVIFAHVYGTKPVPTSYVLPFSIGSGHGAYGTILEASLPQVTGEWGYVTGLHLRLQRRFAYRSRPRSYISASCPAPKGFPGAIFPFAHTTFAFAGGPSLSSTLTRSCKVR
jgi:DNA-binding beta-propeller fold protein YncE